MDIKYKYNAFTICYKDIERDIEFQKSNDYLKNLMYQMVIDYRNEQIKKILYNEVN